MLENMKIEIADGIELHIRKDKIGELVLEKLGITTTEIKPVKRRIGQPVKVKPVKVKPTKIKPVKRQGRKKIPLKKKDILKALSNLKIATANEIRVEMGLSKLYANRLSVHISELKSAGVLKGEGRRPFKYSLKEMTQEQFADIKFKTWWEKVTK